MNRIKGILYAAVSSSTFWAGSVFFSITLLLAGFSAFEVLFLSLGSGVDCIDCVWLVIRLQFFDWLEKIGELFFC